MSYTIKPLASILGFIVTHDHLHSNLVYLLKVINSCWKVNQSPWGWDLSLEHFSPEWTVFSEQSWEVKLGLDSEGPSHYSCPFCLHEFGVNPGPLGVLSQCHPNAPDTLAAALLAGSIRVTLFNISLSAGVAVDPHWPPCCGRPALAAAGYQVPWIPAKWPMAGFPWVHSVTVQGPSGYAQGPSSWPSTLLQPPPPSQHMTPPMPPCSKLILYQWHVSTWILFFKFLSFGPPDFLLMPDPGNTPTKKGFILRPSFLGSHETSHRLLRGCTWRKPDALTDATHQGLSTLPLPVGPSS